MVRVKVCGITNLDDALAAVNAGADALGFVFAPSPRRIDAQAAREIIEQLPPLVASVGVFVNQSPNEMATVKDFCGLDLVQFHGDESELLVSAWGRRAIKALSVDGDGYEGCKAYPLATLLLDACQPGARGGTGRTCDWEAAARISRERPVILAGGLNPENIRQAIAAVAPYGVDASSGLESKPGRKDHAKISDFIALAKRAG
jgi:phosphoribosylanthranilate isomerase